MGQALPVEVDVGELQRMDELAIGQSLGANRRVDALDPESPEAPLLHLAFAIGVLPGLRDGLAGDADGVLAAAVIALRIVQDPLVLGARGYAAFDSWHVPLLLVEAVGGPELDPRRICLGQDFGAAVLAD